MKRRLQISTTSRGFQEACRSDSHIPSAIAPECKDLSRRKRVRFKDLDDVNLCGSDNDSLHVEAVHPLKCGSPIQSDDAKTSEYAFYKKLKKDAGHKVGFHPLNYDANRIQAKNLKSGSYSKERSKIVADSCNKEIEYSFRVEKATPVNIYSFQSPLGNASKNSDMKKGCTTLDHLHGIDEDMEEDDNALRPEGTQYRHADTFSRKRQKLYQWVAGTSFPDTDRIRSKGYNIISLLLGRLIPKSNENKNLTEQKAERMETHAKSLSLASPKSDIDCKNIQLIPTRNLVEHECGHYFVDSISSSWSSRSRERIPYLGSDSPTRCVNETQHHYRVWESDSALRGGITTFCAESDRIFPICKYGSVGHVKELDLFSQPNGYLVGRELDMPMLDWDFDGTKDERNFSTAYQDIKVKMHPTSSASFVDDNQYYANGLFSSSNLHDNGESKNSLPLSCLFGYRFHDHEFGRHLLEGKEDIIPHPSHLPLTLSCTPDYFTAEDCHNDNGSEGVSNFFTPHRNNWFMSKVIEGYDYLNTEALLSSKLVLDLGLKCFPLTRFPEEIFLSTYQALQFPGMEGSSSHLLTNDDYDSCLNDSNHRGALAHFSENNLSLHNYPSFEFQLFQNREQAWPLLVDKSSLV